MPILDAIALKEFHASLETLDVPCPELGYDVRLREWTAADQDAWDAEISKRRGPQDSFKLEGLRRFAVELSAVDAHGVKVFLNGQAAALESFPAKCIERIYKAVIEMNDLKAETKEGEGKN